MDRSVFDLLRAEGPHPEDRAALSAYGQFVGSWDLEGIWYTPDAPARHGRGEWHFDWVLGGRGIQDVLFAVGAPADQFGTTLRCYDRELGAWRVTWMQPASGEFVNLIGRLSGDSVVAETVEGRPRRRWTFTDITPHSFLWKGEVAHDDGEAWFLEQKMRAVRRGV